MGWRTPSGRYQRPSGSQPVLHSQAGHSGKLAGIVGDMREIGGKRVGGNQVIVCTDRGAGFFERRADVAVLHVYTIVEGQNLDSR